MNQAETESSKGKGAVSSEGETSSNGAPPVKSGAGENPDAPTNTELKDLISRSAEEDPLVRFLVEKLGIFSHWRRNLLIVLIIAGGLYAKRSFEANYREEMAQSSDVFWRAQSAYSKAIANSEEAGDSESLRDLERFVKALENQRAPYNEFASIYESLKRFREGEIDLALKVLPPSAWVDASPESSQRFVGELSALLRARLLLASGAEGRVEALGLLEQLSSRGELLASSATLTFKRLAQSDEERSKAESLIGNLLQRQPEQAPVLRPSNEAS